MGDINYLVKELDKEIQKKKKGLKMSQIKIQDLLPLLKPGFIAMDSDGWWWWFETEPSPDGYGDRWILKDYPNSDCSALDAFNISPFEGDWKDSLMECGK